MDGAGFILLLILLPGVVIGWTALVGFVPEVLKRGAGSACGGVEVKPEEGAEEVEVVKMPEVIEMASEVCWVVLDKVEVEALGREFTVARAVLGSEAAARKKMAELAKTEPRVGGMRRVKLRVQMVEQGKVEVVVGPMAWVIVETIDVFGARYREVRGVFFSRPEAESRVRRLKGEDPVYGRRLGLKVAAVPVGADLRGL